MPESLSRQRPRVRLGTSRAAASYDSRGRFRDRSLFNLAAITFNGQRTSFSFHTLRPLLSRSIRKSFRQPGSDLTSALRGSGGLEYWSDGVMAVTPLANRVTTECLVQHVSAPASMRALCATPETLWKPDAARDLGESPTDGSGSDRPSH